MCKLTGRLYQRLSVSRTDAQPGTREGAVGFALVTDSFSFLLSGHSVSEQASADVASVAAVGSTCKHPQEVPRVSGIIVVL